VGISCGSGRDSHSEGSRVPALEGELSIPTGVGRMIVNDGGEGAPAVVFLHSLGGRYSQWKAQLEHLRPDHRAIAVEYLGHGKSDEAGDRDYSLTALARALERVVEELDLDRVVLVGHSFGAGVAAEYARMHPEQVAGLLLVDPIGDQRQVQEEIRAWVAALRSGDYDELVTRYWESILTGAEPGVGEVVLEDLAMAREEAVVNGFASTADFDAPATLNSYGGPMLMIRTPSNDFEFSLHQVMPSLREEIVNGTSHWLHMDNPERFNQLLDQFLTETRED
jgi:pimeloyl-ACP methyl ester carboxylesterase